MAKYTNLEEHEIHLLAQRYGLEVSDFSPIEAGAANSNFFLNASGRDYVLTISDDKGIESVHNLVRLLDHLNQREFPTSCAIAAVSGEKVTVYWDKAVFVKDYIPGCNLNHIHEAGLYTLGTTLSRLHLTPAPDFIARTYPYGLSTFSKVFGQNYDIEFEDWLAVKKKYLEKNIPADLPRGLIHGDVFWDNLIFLGGEFQALIDFECVCEYFKLYDLATAFIGVCLEDGVLNLEKASHIVRGYQHICLLDENERSALQLFTTYAAVAISSWRYLKYNLYNPTEEKKNSHQKKAAIAERVQAIPAGEFDQVFN